MTVLKRQMKRYELFFLLLVVNDVLLLAAPEVGKESLRMSFAQLTEMLTIIPPVFLLMGLMDVWIPKEVMMKYMGKGAGIRGGVFAFALGSLAAGPLYAAFPMASVFLKKGVSLLNVFLFIGAWSTTKIPMMFFEVTQLGVKFALARFFLNLASIILLAFIMERTTGEKESEAIYQRACAQQKDH